MKGTVVIALVALMAGAAGGVWYASRAADAKAADSRWVERLAAVSYNGVDDTGD